jgi:hypothetical protein
VSRTNKYVFGLIWALPVVALFYLGISIAWPAHVTQMARTFGLCIGFASVVSSIYHRVPIIGVAISAGVASIIIFGIMPHPTQFIYWVFVVALVLVDMRSLYKDLLRRRLLVIATSALVLGVVLLPYFRFPYSEPFNESVLLNSGLHIDTLWHVAIASMLKIHHVVSHGLHGLGQLDYHFGSHLLMASASKLSGLTVFESYSYFFVFFCVPLLGVMVLSVGEELLPSIKDSDFWGKLLAYGFFMLGTGVLASGSLLVRFALWPSFFGSESFAVSLIFLLSLVSILHAKISSFSSWFRVLVICSVFALMTLAKISTAFCALGVLGSWALLSGELWWSKKWIERWVIFFLCLMLFWILLQFINPGMSDAKINPFQFINTYVVFPGPFWLKLILFIFFHFIFPILALVLYAAKLTLREPQLSFPGWWALGTGVSLVIGMAVVLSMEISGGAGFYFSNVSMFMALPMLVCIPQVCRTLLRNPTPSLRFPRGVLVVACRTAVFLGVLGVCIYAPRPIIAGSNIFLSQMNQHPPVTVLAAYVEKLRTVRDDPTSLNAVVYIPRTETAYWTSMFCRSTGYFIPAISERPALYAWPTMKCYDFLCGPRFYSNGLCEKSQESFTDKQLISEARRLGFDGVYIVTSKGIRSLR